MRWILLYVIGLILWLPDRLYAQHVLYSETFATRSSTRFQFIGKSENFYWVAKLQKQKSYNRRNIADIPENLSFALFDAKLNMLNEISSVIIPGSIKQWLVAGKKGLDQLVISLSANKTKIICTRFQTGKYAVPQTRLIDSLPVSVNPSAFILVRSEDQSKILMVAFENSDPEITRLHAILFDSDWNCIFHQVISKRFFSQPCIQDEEIGFPAESFDNLPIKLTNNGEWMMASPSRISRNFSLFHVCANGSEYYFRELPVSPYYKMEDIAMSIDNEKQEMSLGLLSGYANTTYKNVTVSNYSMKQGSFYFDTSFRFNTQARDIQSKNLSHESFIAVPGGGFMLLKEYGSPHAFSRPVIPLMNEWETAYLLANYAEINPVNDQIKEGYSLNHGLSPIPFVRNRGDLNLFYFPAFSRDTVWSSILEIEQHTESNNPDLSYLFIPAKNKIYILYNSVEASSNATATTTTLNMHGQVTDDALIFWRMDKMLNFQLSRRFSADEVAVPFLNNQQKGFAIIRLMDSVPPEASFQ